jgi:hypothetical protein
MNTRHTADSLSLRDSMSGAVGIARITGCSRGRSSLPTTSLRPPERRLTDRPRVADAKIKALGGCLADALLASNGENTPASAAGRPRVRRAHALSSEFDQGLRFPPLKLASGQRSSARRLNSPSIRASTSRAILQAEDHRDEPFWRGLVELPARRRLDSLVLPCQELWQGSNFPCRASRFGPPGYPYLLATQRLLGKWACAGWGRIRFYPAFSRAAGKTHG